MSDDALQWAMTVARTDSVLWPNPDHGPWRVRCTWAEVDGYARLTGIELENSRPPMMRPGEKSPVSILTATVLRDLPLDAVAGRVLDKIKATQGEFYVGPSDGLVGRHVSKGRTGRPPLTADDLAQVAAIYKNGGTKPTKAVAEALHITPTAAAKRVARARAAGFLEETLQGRAGGPSGTAGAKKSTIKRVRTS